MKISELETERAFDVICDIMPNVKAISSDVELREQLKELAKLNKDLQEKTKTAAQIVTTCLDAICDFIPVILKKHKYDIFAILSLVNNIPVNDIGKQKFNDTLKQIKDLVKDEAFTQLFT